MTTIKLKNGSGAPTAGDLVQGEPALDLTNKRLYTEDSGGTVIEVGTNPGTDVTFADNRKAVFGAGSDLQIYHDGFNSYIDDAGTGNLFVRASDNFYVQNSAGTETKAAFTTDGAVTLYYNGGTKFQTVAGGIDVTGTVTADGLTVDGQGKIQGAFALLDLVETDITDKNTRVITSGGQFRVDTVNDALSSSTKRIMVDHATGDISFYEDTGTTAKLFWDAAAESLGIGTSSPDGTLHVHSGSAGTITAAASANNLVVENNGPVGLSLLFDDAASNAYGNIYWGNETDGSADGRITYFGSTYVTAADRQSMEFRTAGTARMRIDSSGKVGIGTSSPSEQLDVQLNAIVNESGAGDKGLFVGPSGFAGSFVYKSSGDAEIAPRSGKNLLFAASTGGTERMRIDSSGNLLVSKTSNDNSTAGVVLRDTGEGSFVVSAGRSGLFNRLSSDGEIINFRKDNTTVGSIASRAGVVTTIVLNPASGNGAGLSGGTKAVVPADEAGIVDNDISLGVSTHRFKDLHLSGGAYLGGTAAANLLDSYEEGTWIPTVVGATTAGSFTYASQVGKYVKVGNAVHIEASIEVSATATSASGVITVNGLPFNKSNNGGFSSITIGWAENVTFAHDQLGAYIVSNQTKINLRHIDSAGTGGFVQGSELGSTFFIFVSGWYSNS